MATDTAPPNEHQVRERANVAGHLARYLVREEYRPEQISRWTDAQWLTAAQAAGVSSAVKRGKVPSEATRGQVIGLVTGHYARIAR